MANKSKYSFNEVERKLDIISDDKGAEKVLLGDGTYGESPLTRKLTEVETNLTEEISVERKRIDNLASLEEGSTTGDAELIDARVDKDGYVHTNVGEHIRNATSQLSSEIAKSKSALSIIKNGTFLNPNSNVIDINEVTEYTSIDVLVWNTLYVNNVFLYRLKTDDTNERLDNYKIVDSNGNYIFENVPITSDTKCIRIYIDRNEGNTNASFDWVVFNNDNGLYVIQTKKIGEVETDVETLGAFKEYTFNGMYIDFTDTIPTNTHIVFEQLSEEFLYVFGMYDNTSSEGFDRLLIGTKGKMLNVTTEKEYHHLRIYSTVDTTHEFRILVNSNEKTVVENLLCEINDLYNKSKISNNNYISRIFKKVVCVGDSYTAGYVQIDDGEEEKYGWNPDFSWVEFMKCITGREWINCGNSGAGVLSWMTRSQGFAKAQSIGLSQAYVVGLGINDAQYAPIPLGSIDDVGTDAQTYYGGMSALIRALNSISPLAKIFVNTCPKNDEVYVGYNNAIREIVEIYKDTYPVFCIDLYEYKELYENTSLTQDYVHGHYTPIGYEQFAEIYNHILSEYIIKNYKKFQDVFKIPCE